MVMARHASLALLPLLALLLLVGCARLVSDDPPSPTPPADAVLPPGVHRLSVHSDGSLPDGDSVVSAMSADGRYVAFASTATNLVDGDTNGVQDVFVHDRATRETTRVSVATGGQEADGSSHDARLSADGRYVVFTSEATNLVPGDQNGVQDVFVHDREDGTTERVSLMADGSESASGGRSGRLSRDGRHVAFAPAIGDVDDLSFLLDRATGTTSVLPDARFDAVTFAGRFRVHQTHEPFSAHLVDRVTGEVVPLDIDVGDPAAAAHAPTPDGRFLLVGSSYQVYRHDRIALTTELVSADGRGDPGNRFSYGCCITADGRHVLFQSMAHDLVPGDPTQHWSLYVRDLEAGVTRRVPVTTGEAPEPSPSFQGMVVSDDGRYVAFSYHASFVDETGRVAGVEGMAPHPNNVIEVFAYALDLADAPPPPLPKPGVELPPGVERPAVRPRALRAGRRRGTGAGRRRGSGRT
jgi:hypothetical protein